MREKRKYVVMSFKTTTAAMAMEKKCGERQIPGRLIPLPPQISAGCGLAWRITPEDYKRCQPEIAGLGLEFEQVAELIL